MGLPYAEYQKRVEERAKFERACDAVAKGLGGDMTPRQREQAGHESSRNRFTINPAHHGRTPMKDHICPAKAYAHHPDASLRALAEVQAAAQHDLNDIMVHGCVHKGKCWAKACRGERKGLSVQYSKTATKWRAKYGSNVLGA